MVYLQVEHIDQQLDEESLDCDYLKFNTIDEALQFIKQGVDGVTGWTLSHCPINADEDDYTLTEV